jgi:hypothetical protein
MIESKHISSRVVRPSGKDFYLSRWNQITATIISTDHPLLHCIAIEVIDQSTVH